MLSSVERKEEGANRRSQDGHCAWSVTTLSAVFMGETIFSIFSYMSYLTGISLVV